MNIETFEQSEITRPTVEQDEAERVQAIALAKELGLDGQVALQSPRVEDAATIVASFKWRLMTSAENLVYGILCPQRTALTAFVAEPIPVRVLEVIRDARPHFEKGFEIWHKSDVTKDPVLVGLKSGGTESWRQPIRYLLARWGDELDNFGVLAKAALEIWRTRQKARFAKLFAEVKRVAADVDGCDVSRFLSEAEHAEGMIHGAMTFQAIEGQIYLHG